MARFKIDIEGKGLQTATIEKLVEAFKKDRNVKASFIKVKEAESRGDRFSEAISLIGDAKSEFESLRDELEEWKSGMPENLQEGQKAQEIDDAISELEECISSAEDLEGKEVNFPGMY